MVVRYVLVGGVLLVAEASRACATCSGPADAPQTLGMNAAILTLFGVLCVVGLTGVIFVGLIARRVARHGADTRLSPAIATPEH